MSSRVPEGSKNKFRVLLRRGCGLEKPGNHLTTFDVAVVAAKRSWEHIWAMKILVIGATRGIGLQLVQQALEGGHSVTALVRKPGNPIDDPQLRVVGGDILQAQTVEEAMAGQDVVCSTIGVKAGRGPITVFSEGIRNVIGAMKKHDVPRLENVSGIGAGDSRNHGGFFYDKLLFPLLMKRIYEDKDRQEEIIRASDVDWVIVRPGFLTNGAFTGDYRVVTKLDGVRARRISRTDVAHFILEQLRSRKYLRQTPLVTG
jgi:putative NADH-flavin reductase